MRPFLSTMIVLLALTLPAHADTVANGGVPTGLGSLFPILGLLLAVLVFLVCRELLCWYWKINQVVALLTEIRDHLKNK